MVELNGTEKQVKWANDIREEMLKDIEHMEEKPAYFGQYIARILGEDFPVAIRRDEESLARRRAAGMVYLNKAKEFIEKEETATAFINRRTARIEDIAEMIKNGRLY